MASKRKKSSSVDGPIKIVGINHGVCLNLFLLMDGWKKEQFTDVTFYCQPSINHNQNCSLQNKLRANRSVLAAASNFFAALLPDCELELDVSISTDLTFEEMFCVLEYIYSGKLMCPTKSKDRILNILKDFDIFVPNHIQTEAGSEPQINEFEELNTEELSETSNNSEDFIDCLEEDGSKVDHLQLVFEGEETANKEPFQSSLNHNQTINIWSSQQNLNAKSSMALRIYSNKNRTIYQEPNLQLDSKLKTYVKEQEDAILLVHSLEASKSICTTLSLTDDTLLKGELATRTGNGECETNRSRNKLITGQGSEDTFTITDERIPDRENVTLSFPGQLYNETIPYSKQLELNVIKRSSSHYISKSYPLSLYHSHTWCYGVYSPVETSELGPYEAKQDDNLSNNKKKTVFVHDWTSFRQPTFLVSRPSRVYGRRQASTSNKLNPQKAVLKLNDIRNMKAFKGKIHVTLNGQPVFQSSLPEIFHGGSDKYIAESYTHNIRAERRSLNNGESDTDKIDLALAKHFLQEEVRTKQRLQLRIKMFSERLAQFKEIARSILKRKREIEVQRQENETLKLIPFIKKSGPQTQCEQCGKMVLASRLSIHLKIHSGVKSHLCDLCGRAFLLKAYLNAHIRINHRGAERPKRFMCSSCGYTCDQKHKLEVHERVHTDERPFDCQYCDKKFREKGTLVRHIRTHTGEKPYACNICGTSYAARDTYVQHYRRKHEQQRLDNPNEPRSRSRHSNVVIYRCEFCQKGFYRILAYEKHRATHTGVAAAVRCTQGDCDFTYSDMTQLKDHMAVCHPGKTYSCGICSKVFLTKQNLANHQSKHDPSLGFHCSYCSMSLTTKASLVAHEKIHTRDKPYECSFCGMRFHSPYLLKIHLRKHQPSQPKRKKARRQVEELTESIETDLSGENPEISVVYY